MIVERSAGAVIFSNKNIDNVEYLLLQYSAGHWEFPKGNIENGEDESQAAYREIQEETGIKDVELVEGFIKKVKYKYVRDRKLVHKEVVFFLGQAHSHSVILSNEHIAYSWSTFNNALYKLTYKTAKDILISANQFIKIKSLGR